VIKPATVRTILNITLSQGWFLHHLDVNNAFLHGDLEETVYMDQPPDFIDPIHPTHVCKLNKALYHLKQTPRAWFQKLRSFLLSNGFKSSQSDHSLFIYSSPTITMYILIYIDDIILADNNGQFM
jgi:Reverse transcriptase (RNA-dependent DNA polymerase)